MNKRTKPISSPRPKGVSVLLPTITVDSWLDESVESILKQDGVDFEIVVIYDGLNADRSRPWATNPCVRIIEIADRSGLANALNIGALNSQYEYVARMDSDDIALPDRLRVQSDYLLAHPAVAVIGTRAQRIDEFGRITGTLGTHNLLDLRRGFLSKNYLIHSSVMFRFAQFNSSGGYSARLRNMEDYDLWLRMALIGELRVIGSEYVQYRVHSNQMSRGARLFSAYTAEVLHGRRTLARFLGVSQTGQLARDIAWSAAQVLRSRGLREPGYSKKSSR
jgi:glycosyltransferase involved in cell wall biosynthesis